MPERIIKFTVGNREVPVTWYEDRNPTLAELSELDSLIRKKYGLHNKSQSDYWTKLESFAKKNGFTVTGKNETIGHNEGSRHYDGFAIDVRTKDKDNDAIDEFMRKARAAGIRVVDERVRPKGQKVWSAQHLHLEVADIGKLESVLAPKPPRQKTQPNQKAQPGTAFDAVFKPQSNPLLDKILPKPLFPAEQPQPDFSVYGNDAPDYLKRHEQLQKLSQEQRDKFWVQHKGSIEYAMKQVDDAFGDNINRAKRMVIKDFLMRFGDGQISDGAVSLALELANEGKYVKLQALTKPDKAQDQLPFTIADYIVAKRNGVPVPTKNKESLQPDTLRDAGSLLVSQADKMLKKYLGLTQEEIDNPKTLASFTTMLSQPTKRLKELDEVGDPFNNMVAAAMPENKIAGFLATPGIAFTIFPDAVIDSIGKNVYGRRSGDTLLDKDLQKNDFIQFGKAVFQIGKYFLPGGPTAIGADTSYMVSRSLQVGPVAAAAETMEGMLKSVHVFEPGIGKGEAAGRLVNAVLMGYGAKIGYDKTKQSIDFLNQVSDVQKKLNSNPDLDGSFNKAQVFKLLQDSEKWADQYIRYQQQLGRDTHAGVYFANVHTAYQAAKQFNVSLGELTPEVRSPGSTATDRVDTSKIEYNLGFIPHPDGRVVGIVVADPQIGMLQAKIHELAAQLNLGKIDEATYKAEVKAIQAQRKELREKFGEDEILYVELDPERQALYDKANDEYRDFIEVINELEKEGNIGKAEALKEKQTAIIDLHKKHREITGHYMLDEVPEGTYDQAPIVATEPAGDYHSRSGSMPFDKNLFPANWDKVQNANEISYLDWVKEIWEAYNGEKALESMVPDAATLKQKLIEKWGYTDREAELSAVIADAQAEIWAAERFGADKVGTMKEMWFRTRIQDVLAPFESKPRDGNEVLNQPTEGFADFGEGFESWYYSGGSAYKFLNDKGDIEPMIFYGLHAEGVDRATNLGVYTNLGVGHLYGLDPINLTDRLSNLLHQI
jgi:hypothetical protein